MNWRIPWAIAASVCGLALTACEPSEFRPVIVPAGGGGYSAPARPAQPAQQPTVVPGAHKMIEDPDAQQETVTYTVWAEDENDAKSQCQNLADTYGNRLDRTEKASNWKNQAGKQKYTCWMTTFGNVKYGDDHEDN